MALKRDANVTAPIALKPSTIRRSRTTAKWLLIVFYLMAAIAHLALPVPFLSITPSWVPFPREVIFVTGLCEALGAFAMLFPRLRRTAGFALALYAVCVFPANIKHTIDALTSTVGQFAWWYHVPRLALQPVIVWWALFAGGCIDWPFARLGRTGRKNLATPETSSPEPP